MIFNLKKPNNSFPEQKNMPPTAGFTLVEVLIYSVLLASLFGTAFVVVNDIFIINDQILRRNELSTNHEFIERKLEWAFSQAEFVDSPVKNSSSTSGITLSTYPESISPVAFTVDDGTLHLSLAGESSTPLTNGHVALDTFLVEHISNEQAESSVHITIVLKTSGNFTATSKAKYYFVVEK